MNKHLKKTKHMEKKIFPIHKIGGAGLLLAYYELRYVVLEILKNREPGTQIIVVVSALAKITRMLEDAFEKKCKGNIKEALDVFQNIKEIHLQRCVDLYVYDKDNLFDLFHEIKYFILHGSIDEKKSTFSKAYLLKFGELMSSEIFYQFLLTMNLSVKLVDAQKMIFASGKDYCYSFPVQPKTSEIISEVIQAESAYNYNIILTQGYICNERLLGLDGSDLTASLIALGLKSCNPNVFVKKTFWKDVDGVIVDGVVQESMSKDSYNKLETVPVRKDAINIDSETDETIIRSFLNLENPGTKIV